MKINPYLDAETARDRKARNTAYVVHHIEGGRLSELAKPSRPIPDALPADSLWLLGRRNTYDHHRHGSCGDSVSGAD